ncbi:hypothetical protein IFVP195_C130186 [Vibrio parahaemolyticus]
MAELVDAPDLGSGAVRCESSSLSFRTILIIIYNIKYAEMAELVDAPDLGSGAARCESSSLSFRTILSLFRKALS